MDSLNALNTLNAVNTVNASEHSALENGLATNGDSGTCDTLNTVYGCLECCEWLNTVCMNAVNYSECCEC